MNSTQKIFGVIFFLMFLAGCQKQQPLIIYITPTPETTEAVQPDVTVEATTPAPTATWTPLPTDTLVPALKETPIPDVTFGAIIDEDYELPTQPPFTSEPIAPTDVPEVVLTQQASIPLLDPMQIGIQIDAERDRQEWAYALDRASQLGVGWIKIQIQWRHIHPDLGPDWSTPAYLQLEGFLLNVEQRGIRSFVSIAKAPDWSRTQVEEAGPPDDPQLLAEFIARLLDSKAGRTIDAIEIWNEPNLIREWQGQTFDGASYMRYFDAAYQAVRAANATMPIITAGLAPTGESEFSRDDRVYLQEMYNAGLGNYPDVFIGIHPYGWGNPPDARCCDFGDDRGWDDDPHFFFLDTLDEYRTIMSNNGHGDIQMWATEFGWATWDGLAGVAPEPWMTYLNMWDQANYVLRALELAQQRSDIGVMFLWNLNFGTPLLIERRDERAAYTIMPYTGRIRPVFWMIYDAVRPDVILNSYYRDSSP